MKYLSLFSGIGGIELGIQQAYFRKEGCTNNQNCIGYSEIDKYAIQIYEKHFPNHTAFGDIKFVRAYDIPDFDLLVGGFPCQAFSIAGKRRGFSDTRGTLFFEIARIVRKKQPRLLLLENVKGLLSHDKGHTFYIIISTLNELGYDCQWQVLNSKDFGVPQNRERVFIVGHLRGTRRPQVFPITQSSKSHLKYSGGVISAREQWLKDGKTNSRNFSQGQRIYSTEGISQTLAGNAGGQGGKTGLYEIVMPVLTPDRPNKRQNGRRMKEDGEPSFTLTAQDKHGIYDGAKIRRLTPTECERLQGFPDGWTKQGILNGELVYISDTQRYKTLGNAVTVNVIQAIMEKLYDGIR